jgi:G3E family GTPase
MELKDRIRPAVNILDEQRRYMAARTEAGDVQTEVTGIRTEAGDVQTEVTGVRTEAGDVQTEVTGVRTEASGENKKMGAQMSNETENVNGAEVSVTLLTGYFGAGKTTLVNHILENADGRRVAVIVNDIGEVNVDARLIGRAMKAVGKGTDEGVVELTNGCICCSLRDDLKTTLQLLVTSGGYDHIVVEASGICEPIPIAQAITEICGEMEAKHPGLKMELDSVIAVADAGRLADEFGCGRSLLETDGCPEDEEDIRGKRDGEGEKGVSDGKDIKDVKNITDGEVADGETDVKGKNGEKNGADGEEAAHEEEDLALLLAEQLEFCSTVILNKTDRVSPQELLVIKEAVKALAPDAELIPAEHGMVDIGRLLDTGGFDLEQAEQSSGWKKALENPEEPETEAYEYGIATFVYYRRRPFDREKFRKYQAEWPKEIIRSKGIFWFSDDPEMAVQFDQVGGEMYMSQVWWIAGMDEDTIKQVLEENPKLREFWDDECGDRMTQLVIIGRDMDRRAIEEALDSCLE